MARQRSTSLAFTSPEGAAPSAAELKAGMAAGLDPATWPFAVAAAPVAAAPVAAAPVAAAPVAAAKPAKPKAAAPAANSASQLVVGDLKAAIQQIDGMPLSEALALIEARIAIVRAVLTIS